MKYVARSRSNDSTLRTRLRVLAGEFRWRCKLLQTWALQREGWSVITSASSACKEKSGWQSVQHRPSSRRTWHADARRVRECLHHATQYQSLTDSHRTIAPWSGRASHSSLLRTGLLQYSVNSACQRPSTRADGSVTIKPPRGGTLTISSHTTVAVLEQAGFSNCT
jgi:hypothetical protein